LTMRRLWSSYLQLINVTPCWLRQPHMNRVIRFSLQTFFGVLDKFFAKQAFQQYVPTSFSCLHTTVRLFNSSLTKVHYLT
jgi:hypothetical protein